MSNMSEIFLILTLVSSSLEVRSEACLFSVIERKREVVSYTRQGTGARMATEKEVKSDKHSGVTVNVSMKCL